MQINASILKGILKSLANNHVDIRKYSFIEKEKLFAPQKKADQMVDAAILFRLISEIRAEYPRVESYYPLFRHLHVLDMGLLGHYLLCCKNIFSSYEKLIEYQLLFSNFVEFKYKRDRQDILWSVQMPYQIYGEEFSMESLSDFELFFRLRIVETLSTGPLYPKKIELFYNRDNSKERLAFFKKQFNCEVSYTKHHNVLHYSILDLNKTIHYQNYTLYTNLDAVLKKEMNRHYSNKSYANPIKSILLNNAELFPVSIQFIARKLHLSIRKLQLILKEENTSFSNIVTEVKLILGIQYLKRGKSMKEISTKLGYKEQGSFSRQFKQMNKITPMQYLQLSAVEKAKILSTLTK